MCIAHNIRNLLRDSMNRWNMTCDRLTFRMRLKDIVHANGLIGKSHLHNALQKLVVRGRLSMLQYRRLLVFTIGHLPIWCQRHRIIMAPTAPTSKILTSFVQNVSSSAAFFDTCVEAQSAETSASRKREEASARMGAACVHVCLYERARACVYMRALA